MGLDGGASVDEGAVDVEGEGAKGGKGGDGGGEGRCVG